MAYQEGRKKFKLLMLHSWAHLLLDIKLPEVTTCCYINLNTGASQCHNGQG